MSSSYKHSITGRITLRLAILLLVVLAVISVGSYHVLNRIILDDSEHYTKALCGIFSDALTYGTSETKGSFSSLDPSFMRKTGDYFCSWYRIDYTFAYFPHVEDGTITILFISEKEKNDASLEAIENLTVEYLFEEDELAIYRDNTQYLLSEDQMLSTVSEVRFASTDADGKLMVVGIGISRDRLRREVWEKYWPVALVTGLILLIMVAVIYQIIRHGLLKPAIRLSSAMSSFIQDGHRGEKLPETGSSDEFSMIAHAFNNMSDDIDSYLEDIRGLTQRQEQQQTALDIAGKIQQSLLKAGACSSPHCEIHAIMSPAADIGGDLYDYMTLDEDRTLIAIADVSGKGISASMFMAASLLLMGQLARMGFSPAQILRHTNNSLSERNPRMQFITAFVAIYNNKTGLLTYSNAGHDLPYVLHGRDSIRTLDGARSIVLGLYPGEEYTDAEEQMKIGDILFLYTDGVNEANNTRKEFFGNGRIEDTLRVFAASHEEDPVAYMENAVRAFAGECEQHDDMTMLSMTVKETRSLLLPVQKTSFEQIRALILQAELPMTLRMDLCLAAEEIFVNICSYAYPAPVPEDEQIRFDLEISDRVLIRFADHGIPYDPTQNVISAEEYDLSVGGLGRLIAFTVADQVSYVYEHETNILTMVKYMKEESHEHSANQ